MATRLFSTLRALLALTTIAVALAGVPAVLVIHVGWPLPTLWPDLDQLTRTGQTHLLLVGALTVMIWIGWAQLATALLTELAAVAHRSTPQRVAVLPGLQALAARLVATALLLAVATQPRPATAGPSLDTALLAVAAAPADLTTGHPDTTPLDGHDPDAPAPAAVETAPATRTITVAPRESWWRLAERHLGDGLRWRDLRQLNLDRAVAPDVTITEHTDHLDVGWQLLVPDTPPADPVASTPAAQQPSAADEAPPDDDPTRSDDPAATVGTTWADRSDAGDAVEPGSWTVQPGEHFWAIAEHTLTDAWDRPPDEAETAGYWRTLVDTNRDRLPPPHDPDLIHPGQHLELPPPPPDPYAQPTAPPPAPATPEPADHGDAGPADDAAGAEDRELGVESDPGVGADAHAAEPGTGESATPSPDHLHDRTAPPSPATVGSTQVGEVRDGWVTALRAGLLLTVEVDDGDGAVDGVGGELAAWRGGPVSGLTAAALAAAGIAVLLRRRRLTALQQRPVGTRLPTPAPAAIDLENRAADPRTLDDLAALLTSIPSDARPALLTLDPHRGQVTLLFDQPPPPGTVGAPWRAVDPVDELPVRWTADIGDPGPARSIGLPLLATLGRLGSTTVLANLAAMGRLTVTGDAGPVRRWLRRVALEVATSTIVGPVEVAVAGETIDRHVDRLHLVDDLDLPLHDARVEHRHGVIDEDRIPRLLICHADATPPEIDADDLDGLVALVTASPGPGLDGWQLHLDSDHAAVLHLPDDATIDLQLPDVDPDTLDAELDRLDHYHPADDLPADNPAGDAPPEDMQEAGWPDVETSGHTPAGDRDAEVPVHPAVGSTNGHRPTPAVVVPGPPFCEVQLLGPIKVVRDGHVLKSLTPLTRQVLLYLVTHRDAATPERLDDAVWDGRLAPPNSQRVRAALTKLRDTLGPDPDGQPLLPPRQQRGDIIRISEHLGSDLDRALAALTRARTAELDGRVALLDGALELVRGGPFEALPLSWATEVTQRAIAQLQDAALAAAALHSKAGRYDAAHHAIQQGLKLCDPQEPLYVAWAQLEAAHGRHDHIPAIWRRLTDHYGTDADHHDGEPVGPTPATTRTFRDLTSATN